MGSSPSFHVTPRSHQLTCGRHLMWLHQDPPSTEVGAQEDGTNLYDGILRVSCRRGRNPTVTELVLLAPRPKVTFCIQGVVSPLLANIYMNRFLKYWQLCRCGETFQGHVVAYADDFIILSRGHANEALTWTKSVMTRLGLTLNEVKTTLKDARQERFDFLGYAFGPHYGVVSRVVVEDVSYPSPSAHPTLAEIGLASFIIWLSALTASATSTGCASSWRARNRSPMMDL